MVAQFIAKVDDKLEAASITTLHFQAGWRESQSGPIRKGHRLAITYDPARLPTCRGEFDGVPVWEITASVKFHPGGEFYSGNFWDMDTSTYPDFKFKAFEVDVPANATQVEMYFHNTTGDACSTWDSRFSQNYWYDVV